MRHPFLRTLAGRQDPYFKNTTLLLHGDGTNGGQNNTFVDGSTNNFTITRNGNTTQGTFSPYGDNWSNYFDGVDDYLRIAPGAAFAFGTGDFTVELWVYPTKESAQIGGGIRMIDARNASQTTAWIIGTNLNASAGNAFQLGWFDGSVDFISTGTLTKDGWNHVVYTRSGTTGSLFLNGARVGTRTDSVNYSISPTQSTIGARFDGTLYATTGYISNIRTVKGTSVYDPTQTTLTVPTSPLTAITNTSLLTCQSNRFRDASTNNFTLTRNGNVSVQRFSPFSPTASYAAGTIGGSGYFDGTGDTLVATTTTTYAQANQDFTVEAWVYRTALGNMMVCGWTGSNSDYWYIQDASISYAFANTYTVGASYSTPVGAWTHIALTRQSGTCRIFVNGNLLSTVTNTNRFGHTSNIRISGYYNSATLFTGYVSDFRFIVGAAQYTANFTPPTAPLTAITNTSLLLNFTNAAILDNAMMAVPETVGNAQIDTTTKKFGTGSLEFDGTGDYLSVPNNVAFNFGTGDFTVEAWVYIAGNSSLNNSTQRAAGVLVSFPTTIQTLTNSWALTIAGNGTTTGTGIAFSSWQSGSQSLLSATVTVSQTSWNHIAVARSGTTTKLFLNGTEVASGTLSNQTVNSGQNLAVGRTGYPGYIEELNGYIDDLRITKGVARYTANFIPPTAPFPDF